MRRTLACIMALVLALGIPAAIAEEGGVVAEAKAVLDQLFAGGIDAVYARTTGEVQAALTREDLATAIEQLAALGGALVEYTGEQTIGNTAVVTMRMERISLLAQVSFDADMRIAGLGFVPEEPPDTSLAENEEAVTVGPYGLAGVLTLPVDAGGAPVPAVVLVHGSGPNDRNETLGGIAPFRDIAEGLAAQGIAVLRYDKRTYAMQQGLIEYDQADLDTITFDWETIEDAVAAAQLLRADPRIDPDRVFLLGHSLGGSLANRIQLAGADAGGLVILAGSLRHLADILADQYEVLDAGVGQLAEDIELARGLADMTEEEARAGTLLGGSAYQLWEETRHDLQRAAEESGVPLLILQGTEDQKVYADRDYPLWEDFAAAHPDRDITLTLYEGLGHEFIDARTGKVSQAVIDDIAAWMLAR